MMAELRPPSGSIAFESSGDDGVAVPDRLLQSGAATASENVLRSAA